ncbi:MAG: fluoride efflux transporter CrcB [Alphaproteobacteria bacterium]
MSLSFLYVGLGGALGAMSRFSVGHFGMLLWGTGFPYGTLVVNVLGSFLIGVIAGLDAFAFHIPREVKLLLITGFLGGFTTFSTFSLDVVTLLERGTYRPAFLYIGVSLIVSCAALWLGLRMCRWMV